MKLKLSAFFIIKMATISPRSKIQLMLNNDIILKRFINLFYMIYALL